MTYTPRELVIFAGSLIAIIASIFNIATGAAGTGFDMSATNGKAMRHEC